MHHQITFQLRLKVKNFASRLEVIKIIGTGNEHSQRQIQPQGEQKILAGKVPGNHFGIKTLNKFLSLHSGNISLNNDDGDTRTMFSQLRQNTIRERFSTDQNDMIFDFFQPALLVNHQTL